MLTATFREPALNSQFQIHRSHHGIVLLDLYGIGPDMVIFSGTNLGSGVILTGILQVLERLSEMVIISMSLVEVTKVAGVT